MKTQMWHLSKYLAIMYVMVRCAWSINLEYKGNNVQDLEQILKAVQKGEASIMGPFSSKQFSELAKRSSVPQNDLNSPQAAVASSKLAEKQNGTAIKSSPAQTENSSLAQNIQSINSSKLQVDKIDSKLADVEVSAPAKKRMQTDGKIVESEPLKNNSTLVGSSKKSSAAIPRYESPPKIVDVKKMAIAQQKVEKDLIKSAESENVQSKKDFDLKEETKKSPVLLAAPQESIEKGEKVKQSAILNENNQTLTKTADERSKVQDLKLKQQTRESDNISVEKWAGTEEKNANPILKSEEEEESVSKDAMLVKESKEKMTSEKSNRDSAFIVYDKKDQVEDLKETLASEKVVPAANISKAVAQQLPFVNIKSESAQLFAVNFMEAAPAKQIEKEENNREKRQEIENVANIKDIKDTKKEALTKKESEKASMVSTAENTRLQTVFAHKIQNSPQLSNPSSGSNTRTATSLTQRRSPPNFGLSNGQREASYVNRPNFYQIPVVRNAPVLRNNFGEGRTPYTYRQASQGVRALAFEGNKIIDVQVVCNLPNNQMIFTVQFKKQFFGVIYAKGYYKVEACRTIGKGSQSVSLVLPLDGCGSTTVSDSWDLTNGITSFQNKIIVMFDNDLGIMSAWDSAYKASCAMGGENGPKISSHITVPMLDSSKIAPTTMNMPPAFMKIVAGKIPTAPRASLLRLGEIGTVVITIQDNVGIFDLTVLNCMAHDGMNMGKIQLLDDKGCPVHNKIIGPQTRETFGRDMLIYAHFKVFKFPDVENVYFECNIKFCFHRCQQPQCGIYGVYTGNSGTRKKRSEIDESFTISQSPNFIEERNNSYNLFQTIKVEIPESNQSPNSQTAQKIEEPVQEIMHPEMDNIPASLGITVPLSSPTVNKTFCLTKLAFGISLSVLATLFFGIASLLAYLYMQKMNELKKLHAGEESCFVPYINDFKANNNDMSPQSTGSRKGMNNQRRENAKYDDFKKTLNSLFFQMQPVGQKQ